MARADGGLIQDTIPLGAGRRIAVRAAGHGGRSPWTSGKTRRIRLIFEEEPASVA